MDIGEPVAWAPGMSLLSDVSPAAWAAAALTATTSAATVAAMVPPVFSAYARVLPPTYDREDEGRRHRWSEIAACRGVALTAETRFDDLVAGSDRWGRPSDGGLDARETETLARVLSSFTHTPDQAYFCLWEGFGLPETRAWEDRPVRVRTTHRAYHLLTGPVSAAPVLPATGGVEVRESVVALRSDLARRHRDRRLRHLPRCQPRRDRRGPRRSHARRRGRAPHHPARSQLWLTFTHPRSLSCDLRASRGAQCRHDPGHGLGYGCSTRSCRYSAVAAKSSRPC